jgi:hypothetical protein
MTNNHILPSHPRLCSLSVASYDSQGLRWKYSNPPPHGVRFSGGIVDRYKDKVVGVSGMWGRDWTNQSVGCYPIAYDDVAEGKFDRKFLILDCGT